MCVMGPCIMKMEAYKSLTRSMEWNDIARFLFQSPSHASRTTIQSLVIHSKVTYLRV